MTLSRSSSSHNFRLFTIACWNVNSSV